MERTGVTMGVPSLKEGGRGVTIWFVDYNENFYVNLRTKKEYSAETNEEPLSRSIRLFRFF
jgi:hypothetical protein